MAKQNQANVDHNLMLPPLPPPVVKITPLQWLQRNLFSSFFDSVLTVVIIIAVTAIVVPIVDWSVVKAIWYGGDRTFCTTLDQGGIQPNGWSGACWAFVKANFSQIIYGRYPITERWRVDLLALIVVLVNIPLLVPQIKHKFINFILSLVGVPAIGYILLFGGVFRLEVVDTQLWGGLLVTLVIAYTSITTSLVVGTLFALGRRSSMPIIRWFSILIIETLRGIPLITILFIASILFPLFLPEGMSFDKLLRALIAISLFTSVYIAEVVRGGLQAITRGQYEAAYSLGLRYWSTTLLVVLPQAIRIVIPAIINTLIGMFKETSLIYVISMFDLLGIIQQLTLQTTWITPQTPKTAYIFAGIVFWVFCFAMSRYAHFIERYLNRSKNNDPAK